MSTRCLIAVRNEDVLTVIYCQFDGYLDGVGLVLNTHYTELVDVMGMIADGDRQSLRGPDDASTYFREGEEWDDVKPEIFTDDTDIVGYAKTKACEYVYVFERKQWTTIEVYG